MSGPLHQNGAEENNPRRLYVYNSGFLTRQRIKRILALSGWNVSLGVPSEGDWIGVWGDAPSASRGTSIAEGRQASVLRVEDAFLRSLHPGRVQNEPPLGLVLDQTGIHFDTSRPSDLETLLLQNPLDDAALLNDARSLMARIGQLRLSKYSAYDPGLTLPEPGYVLVVDQAEGDASVKTSVPGENTARPRFAEMLYYAQTEHPHAHILIRSHPETVAGTRGGHYTSDQATGRVSFLDGNYAIKDILDGAIAVYTLSSHVGFEAILAGHQPRVFGTPFYAGWGLTKDEHHLVRRQRSLTRAQMFAAAMMIYPFWYDPYRDRLCNLHQVVATLEAMQRAWRDDHQGWIGESIRLWKRPHLQRMFGGQKRMRFGGSPRAGERVMVWGSRSASTGQVSRIEDGFVRSHGLGAQLVPPLSLALDDKGIYYDPTQPSRLEELITQSVDLPEGSLARARAVIDMLKEQGITKYATGFALCEPLPKTDKPILLVPGQVEDDASIELGSPDIKSNSALLQRVRHANADAFIVYKPHPDVVAGLRPGHVSNALEWADLVVEDAPIASLITQVDSVWTMTSLAGFEALIRDMPVTTLGIPFYAGWGLTTDLCEMPERRGRLVSLEGLVHAALIDYPRYFDPMTGLPCPIEVALDRLVSGEVGAPTNLKLLAKAQSVLASYPWIWRR